LENEDEEGFFSYTLGIIGYFIFIIMILLNTFEKYKEIINNSCINFLFKPFSFDIQKGFYISSLIEDDFINKKFSLNGNLYISQNEIVRWDEVYKWMSETLTDSFFPIIPEIDANTRIQGSYLFYLQQTQVQQRLLQSQNSSIPIYKNSHQVHPYLLEKNSNLN
jgi:hypothetical protein